MALLCIGEAKRQGNASKTRHLRPGPRRGYTSGCVARILLLYCLSFHFTTTVVFPASRYRIGGLVRLIRPLNVARLLATAARRRRVHRQRRGRPAAARKNRRPQVRDQETHLFRLRVQGPEGPAGPRPRRRRAPANRPGCVRPPGGDDASVQDRCDRRPGARTSAPRPPSSSIPRTGQVLWEENAQDKRSIASITKVMTAVVFLEDNPDLLAGVTIERGDVYAASTTYLRANERITLDNVLHLTLIASDNAAARALARVSHGGTASFVERMNEKALELGLESTTFADPSGLNPTNISSAYDLSRLITFASPTSGSRRSCGRPTIRSRPAAARSTSTTPITSCAAGKST